MAVYLPTKKSNLKNDKQLLTTLKLPLVAAVSSCLLVACSSTPTKKGVIETTPIAVAPPSGAVSNTVQSNTPVVVPVPTTTTATMPDLPRNPSGLDQETLQILADLLEARDMSMVQGDINLVNTYGNLWDKIRSGYGLQPIYNVRIANQQSWFGGRQDYINRLTARASRYLHYTTNEAKRRGIPTELALLPIIESSYDPSATSNAAAAGLWQFIPSTGRIYGLNQSNGYDGRRDIIESTRAAYDFLTSLYNQFGSWELALAAYNAGPGRVQRAIDANRVRGLPTDYWSLSLPNETMNYVPRFFAVAQIIGNPNYYGMNLPPIADQVYFRTVPVRYDVTLDEIARIINVPLLELQLLNPALTQSRIDRAGPARVVIPNHVSKQLDAKIQKLGSSSEALYMTENMGYIPPKVTTSLASSESAEQLKSIQALPTTGATITPNNSVVQEPPLTAEERQFIVQQIRQSDATAQPVSQDGNIDLNALQTAQSVLQSRNQTKHLSYQVNALSGTKTQVLNSGHNQSKISTKPKTYIVQVGDTLSGIASTYGLSVAQLRQWNNLEGDLVRSGSKLKLYGDTVISHTVTQKSASNQKPNTIAQKPKLEKYKIQAGDTLTGVAHNHGLTVAQLAEYNNLDTEAKLIRGQSLWIVPNKVSKVNTNKTDSKKTTINKASKMEAYKVQAGDTLIGLANRYEISVAELAAANNLSTDAGLIRDKVIQIPQLSKSKPKSSQESGKMQKSDAKSIADTESYKVQSGDTLTALAEHYQVSIADLAKTNNLSNNAHLIAGQTIKVPKLTKTHLIKSGESLIGLARRYGIDVKDLAKMNDLKPTDGLRTGQKLIVPNK